MSYYLKVKPFFRPWVRWRYVTFWDFEKSGWYGLTTDRDLALTFSGNGLYKAQDHFLGWRQRIEVAE